MDKEPETYEELMRMKKCVELTKYYSLTKEELETIYNFLKENPDAKVVGDTKNISLIKGANAASVMTIASACISTIDGIVINNKGYKVIPHYTPSSGSGGYGGSSSNNNNNNNNNNYNNNR